MPTKVDPALLTLDEFQGIVGAGKSHPSSAYNWSLAEMNDREWDTRENYPTLLFRKRIGGILFEFRLNKEDNYRDNTFSKRDPEGEILRINGEVQNYSREELLRMNDPKYRRYEYSFAVFDGDSRVALAQDEWGCVLVSVAQEYRNFGLGVMLTKMAWEAEPGKTTGGCTPAGAQVVVRAHREFVRDYLKNGLYSQMIREGTLTKERVREILNSARISEKPKPSRPRVDLNTNDPRDLMLYMEDGSFILYSRKLKDLLEQGNEDQYYYWFMKCIKGHSFAGAGYHDNDRLYLHQLGGDTPAFKSFMFSLALSYCQNEGVPLYVYDDDLGMVHPDKMNVDGHEVSLKGAPISYQGNVVQEKQFRRTFDRYDEFKVRLQEFADVKYR